MEGWTLRRLLLPSGPGFPVPAARSAYTAGEDRDGVNIHTCDGFVDLFMLSLHFVNTVSINYPLSPSQGPLQPLHPTGKALT